MHNYTWYVICKNMNGRTVAIALRIANNNNLVGYFQDQNVISINACDSKTDAFRISGNWNRQFDANQ